MRRSLLPAVLRSSTALRLPATLLLPAALLVAPPALHAQTMLLLQGGVTRTEITGDGVPANTDWTDGITGGVSVGFPVNDFLAIAPGIMWAAKGFEREVGAAEVEVATSWVEFPLLAILHVAGSADGVGVSLFGGPEVAFEVGCTIEEESFEDGGGADIDGPEVDCDDNPGQVGRQTTDFGLIFGAGVSYPLGRSVLAVLSGGLDLGLRDLSGTTGGGSVKNSGYFLTLGAAIPLGTW